MRRRLLVSLVPLALVASRDARADVVTDWNTEAIAVIKDAGASTNAAPRALAILHIAVHNAVATVTRDYQRYGESKLTAVNLVDINVAASTAAHRVLVELFGSRPDGGVGDAGSTGGIAARRSAIDGYYESKVSGVAGAARTNAIALGEAAAKEILTWRAADGANAANEVNRGSTAEGKWRPTPPANASALEPQWRNVLPFGLTSASEYRPAQPPVLQSAGYKAALDEVKLVGDINSRTRTPAQTEIAQFWAQATHLPLNAIARVVAERKGLAVAQNARLFALLNIALADSRVAVWDAKFAYNFWRPVTAINDVAPAPDGGAREAGSSEAGEDAASAPEAGSDAPTTLTSDVQGDGASTSLIDGDAAVSDANADPVTLDSAFNDTAEGGADAGARGWEPLLVTPAHPEYPSGHTTTGTAGTTVLAELLGPTAEAFAVTSDTLPNVTHTFTRFDDVALENGQSRIYGGIHFAFSNSEGRALGNKVGLRAVTHLLLPLTADAGLVDGSRVADASSSDGHVNEASSIVDGDARATDAAVDAPSGPPLIDSSDIDEGCSCRTAASGQRSSSKGFLVAIAAGVLVLARRRRR